MATSEIAPERLSPLRSAFEAVPGYLDAATLGLPARASMAALTEALRRWQDGAASAAGYDLAVQASRTAYARLVGVAPEWVAVGSQVSAQLAVVGSSLPDGAEVLVPEDDFASVVFPFLVHRDRGVSVRQVPLARLAEEIRPSTTVVAFSLAQSADGRLADLAAVQLSARAHGTLTVCDTTQAVGWLPVAAGEFDVTVCAAYKWLSCPRGVSFMTARPEVWERLRPVAAGWYAGESVWDSIYGPEMALAGDARRFDVSPAWLAWVGAAPALELFADASPSARSTGVSLAARVRSGLAMAETRSPVVSLSDPTGALTERLRSAGCAFATRSGRIRLAFHVWNDDRDADLVMSACAS